MASAAGSNLQKKIIDYARDYAFEKISKKLEKAQAKQQERMCVRGEQSTTATTATENCRIYIDNESEVRMIERSGYRQRSEQTRFLRNELNGNRQSRSDIAYIQLPIESRGSQEDDAFLTAEEDDEDDIKTAREFIRQKQRRMSRTVKSGIVMEADSIESTTEDAREKLTKTQLAISSPPETPALPASPHFLHHGSSTADYTGYIQKKSLAQGMMDLALVSANTNQLRYILEYQNHHPYFGISLALVILSLVLQVGVGMTLIWNTRFNVKRRDEMKEADRVNNISVIGIFMVTLINVFLSTFGGAPQNPTNLPIEVTDASDSSESTTTERMIYH